MEEFKIFVNKKKFDKIINQLKLDEKKRIKKKYSNYFLFWSPKKRNFKTFVMMNNLIKRTRCKHCGGVDHLNISNKKCFYNNTHYKHMDVDNCSYCNETNHCMKTSKKCIFYKNSTKKNVLFILKQNQCITFTQIFVYGKNYKFWSDKKYLKEIIDEMSNEIDYIWNGVNNNIIYQTK